MENQFTPSDKMYHYIVEALHLLIKDYETKIEHIPNKQENEKSELENDLGIVKAVLTSFNTKKNQRFED